ncbi:uncharacterized protein LOC133418524 [Cololabis saira]|uniref:uncharacterized protein LOC133418524 n=1 Tax=Cololabis saira TaxID=129043 RepID=UPI002AD37DCE|nr:uncharacterized protein LOC133418524 [Cololabis saira]
MTAQLQLFITLLLHFGAGISDGIVLHRRAGDDVVLPPDFDSHYPCSDVDWLLYNPYINFIVSNGSIVKTSPGADKISLSSNCSLIINNITAENAGLYNCRVRKTVGPTSMFLNVLTVSPYQPHGDPGRDEDVTLRCSLNKYLYGCEKNSIIWLDETGTVLVGEGDGFVSGGQESCVHYLIVKYQKGSKRRFTCRVVDGWRVKIESEYTLDFTDSSPIDTVLIIEWVFGGLMVVLVIIAMFPIIYRMKVKMNNPNNQTDVHLPCSSSEQG